jgi:hypothetical protein
MKEDWLNEIRDRMAEYETDEPSGLWEGIVRAMEAKEVEVPRRPAMPVVWRRIGRIAAVAASVALVFTIGHYLGRDKDTPVLTTTEAPVAGHAAATADNRTAVRNEVEGNAPLAASHDSPELGAAALADVVSRVLPESGSGAEPESEPKPEPKPKPDLAIASAPAEDVPESPTPDNRQPRRENHPGYNNYIAQANTGGRKSAGRLSVGVFTTGGTGSSFNRKSTGNPMALNAGSDGAAWESSPILGMLTFNRDRDIERGIKHRLPLRAGVSFSYELGDRISIESGVTYANLTSDIREGSKNHYFAGKQTIHYIGIPLNLKYRVVSWGGLDLYASAGILAEKSVSGRLKTRYVLDDKPKDAKTESLNVKPLQWSVAVSAGAQYNFAPAVGIYAEPGLGYYFDNGSPVKTIYKDKPLNFNLNLGVRFNLGLK